MDKTVCCLIEFHLKFPRTCIVGNLAYKTEGGEMVFSQVVCELTASAFYE